MDKELLRVVIILIGVLVMIGMLLWSFFKSLREQREEAQYDTERNYNPEVAADKFADFNAHDDAEEFDVELRHPVADGETLQVSAGQIRPENTAKPNKPAHTLGDELPGLIEFSIVARHEQGFNGEDLFDAFERVGLEYGTMRVFERIDENRLVDFAVACMVKPGIFPDTNLATFFTPGIVFFMQPRELDRPLAVFDDFIETIDILAEELDGVVWDSQRQPLSDETIEHLRLVLAEA